MINKFTDQVGADAFVTANTPNFVHYDIGEIVVYTGTDIPPAPVAKPVVYEIQAAWLMIVMEQQGLLASVQGYVAAASVSNPAISLLWSPGVVFQSDNRLILDWASANGKAQADVDAIFIAAITLAAE